MKVDKVDNIKDFPGYYISREGFLYSRYDKVGRLTDTYKRNKTYVRSNGYVQVVLKIRKENRLRRVYIHRLVAETFLNNFNNYSQVNHIDENKLNNNLDNLEWCSAKYNLLHNDRATKIGEKLGKKVFVYNKKYKLIYTFSSSKEASYFLHIPDRGIRKACVRNNHLYKNYIWSYEKLDK